MNKIQSEVIPNHTWHSDLELSNFQTHQIIAAKATEGDIREDEAGIKVLYTIDPKKKRICKPKLVKEACKGSQFYNDENSSLSYETSSKLVSKKVFC